MALSAELKEQVVALCWYFDKYEEYIICLSRLSIKTFFYNLWPNSTSGDDEQQRIAKPLVII